MKRQEAKPCGVSARLSRCYPSAWDHVTRRHQSTVGFLFIFPPMNLSLGGEKKEEKALRSQNKPHVPPHTTEKNIPFVSVLFLAHTCFMRKNKSIFCGNRFAAGLAGNFPQHCHFPTLTLLRIHLFQEQSCYLLHELYKLHANLFAI